MGVCRHKAHGFPAIGSRLEGQKSPSHGDSPIAEQGWGPGLAARSQVLCLDVCHREPSLHTGGVRHHHNINNERAEPSKIFAPALHGS